ncbi:hypothetical protein [Fructobacillus tropaeoli]|uniref:Uncharacterized protein n=1 Tax=Fructobacillus tropaeoli TaxID=709323 RepID=A0A3F3H6A3_9LACO|nr:hypothetical protein [Fructobacillus tropaeoli]GAP05052.1 hypothetical protein FTRO_0300010 [Fructobacillus tropaeoli]
MIKTGIYSMEIIIYNDGFANELYVSADNTYPLDTSVSKGYTDDYGMSGIVLYNIEDIIAWAKDMQKVLYKAVSEDFYQLSEWYDKAGKALYVFARDCQPL